MRPLRTGPSIERDCSARRTVAAFDFDRGEKKKRLVRQSAKVGQELNPDHVVAAQRPVSMERLLIIDSTESRTIGTDAAYSLGVQVLDGIRAERRPALGFAGQRRSHAGLAFAERLEGPVGVTAAQEHDLIRTQGSGHGFVTLDYLNRDLR